MKVFFEQQANIALNRDFDKELLSSATREIKKHGLYTVATKQLPGAISRIEAMELGIYEDSPELNKLNFYMY